MIGIVIDSAPLVGTEETPGGKEITLVSKIGEEKDTMTTGATIEGEIGEKIDQVVKLILETGAEKGQVEDGTSTQIEQSEVIVGTTPIGGTGEEGSARVVETDLPMYITMDHLHEDLEIIIQGSTIVLEMTGNIKGIAVPLKTEILEVDNLVVFLRKETSGLEGSRRNETSGTDQIGISHMTGMDSEIDLPHQIPEITLTKEVMKETVAEDRLRDRIQVKGGARQRERSGPPRKVRELKKAVVCVAASTIMTQVHVLRMV